MWSGFSGITHTMSCTNYPNLVVRIGTVDADISIVYIKVRQSVSLPYIHLFGKVGLMRSQSGWELLEWVGEPSCATRIGGTIYYSP